MSLQPVFINFNFSVPFQFHKISGNKIYQYKVRDMVSFFFSLSYAHDKTKNVFLYFFTELKTYHLC